MIEAIDHNLFSTLFSSFYIPKTKSSAILKFWRKKSKIYAKYINNQYTVSFESSIANSIPKYFNISKLEDALEITEADILEKYENEGFYKTEKVLKYKHPLKYVISIKKKRVLPNDYNLMDLKDILKKERAKNEKKY